MHRRHQLRHLQDELRRESSFGNSPSVRCAERLAALRAYTAGSLRKRSSEGNRYGSPQPAHTRIAFIGEFGAGKSSLINTIWHVVAKSERDEFEKIFQTSEGGLSVTTAPVSAVLPSSGRRSQGQGAITLFDTPGFMQFADGLELAVMRTYRFGMRESQDVLNLARGKDSGNPGGRLCPIDHFVWVFALQRRALAETETADTGRNPHIRVTRKDLERKSSTRSRFASFFDVARPPQGETPTVVLTHCDQFTDEEVADGKQLVKDLTGITADDIFVVSSFRNDWGPQMYENDLDDAVDEGVEKTRRAVVDLLYTALQRADTCRPAYIPMAVRLQRHVSNAWTAVRRQYWIGMSPAWAFFLLVIIAAVLWWWFM